MENNKLLAAVIIVIIVIAGSIAVWQLFLTEPSPTENGPESIKIGLVAPYQIPVGQDMDRAARMAVQEINDAGGIYVSSLGKSLPIELVTGDTENANPDAALNEVTRLVSQENVDLLIGGFGSGATLAGQVPVIEAGVP